MADQGKTRRGKRLQTPCAPRGALHGSPGGRLAPGSGLWALLCGADAAAGERARAAAAAITVATSGAAAAAAEAAVGRFPLPRLPKLRAAAPS